MRSSHGGYQITVPSVKASSSPPMRCAHNGTVEVQVLTGANRTLEWRAVVVAGDANWQAGIGFAFPGGSRGDAPVRPYAHLLADGTRAPGVFLGARNRTTWFYKDNWAGNAGEYYLLRLIGPGVDANMTSRDFVGLLKIVV